VDRMYAIGYEFVQLVQCDASDSAIIAVGLNFKNLYLFGPC